MYGVFEPAFYQYDKVVFFVVVFGSPGLPRHYKP